jgi:hypothetical protein
VLLFFLMICFAFIPWATIMIVMLRVGGLLAFGPHMHIVGKRLNDAADVTSAAEDAFEQLSPADKEKRLKTYREDLIKDEARRILTDAARLEPNARRRLLERATFFEECGSRRVLVPSELSAARIMPGGACRSNATRCQHVCTTAHARVHARVPRTRHHAQATTHAPPRIGHQPLATRVRSALAARQRPSTRHARELDRW